MKYFALRNDHYVIHTFYEELLISTCWSREFILDKAWWWVYVRVFQQRPYTDFDRLEPDLHLTFGESIFTPWTTQSHPFGRPISSLEPSVCTLQSSGSLTSFEQYGWVYRLDPSFSKIMNYSLFILKIIPNHLMETPPIVVSPAVVCMEWVSMISKKCILSGIFQSFYYNCFNSKWYLQLSSMENAKSVAEIVFV